MKIRDYMTTDVTTANLRDGMRQTFFRMRERGIRHMPVIGDRGELAGIISDRDLRRPDWVSTEENVARYYLLDNAHKVKDAMTPDPVTVRADDEIAVAVALLTERRFGALPVVDDRGRLVGMISTVDLLRAFHAHLA
jgi:acetoin utilization protein AcuB